VQPGLLSLVTPEAPLTRSVTCMCHDAHVRVQAFDTKQGLEALQEQLLGALEEACAGRTQLAEHVARFPQQVDELLGEERAIAGEAVVCG